MASPLVANSAAAPPLPQAASPAADAVPDLNPPTRGDAAAASEEGDDDAAAGGGGGAGAGGGRDLTAMPAAMDAAFAALDSDGALRPMVIKPSGAWTRTAPSSIMDKSPAAQTLGSDAQAAEKRRAFDLLDALTRAGALPLRAAELHVLLGAQHCFEDSVLDSLAKRNVDPIQRVERSMLIVAATLHGVRAAELLRPDAARRIAAHSPALLAAAGAAAAAE
jgi:hypothetical protein